MEGAGAVGMIQEAWCAPASSGELRSKPPGEVTRAAVLIPVTSVYRKPKCCPECSGWSLNAFDPYLEILLAYVI